MLKQRVVGRVRTRRTHLDRFRVPHVLGDEREPRGPPGVFHRDRHGLHAAHQTSVAVENAKARRRRAPRGGRLVAFRDV